MHSVHQAWHSSNYRVSMKSPTLNGLKLDSIKNRRQRCLWLLIFAKTSERERREEASEEGWDAAAVVVGGGLHWPGFEVSKNVRSGRKREVK